MIEEKKVDDVPFLKEKILDPVKKWVIKKVKDYRRLK